MPTGMSQHASPCIAVAKMQKKRTHPMSYFHAHPALYRYIDGIITQIPAMLK